MMQRSFPLFQGHLDFAHSLWKGHLKPGDWAIDATCGNGRDTALLAQLIGSEGGIIALDLQEEAIASSKKLLFQNISYIHFYCQSHASFPTLCLEKPIRLIVYNLGYLPGGNKEVTTQVDTTLASVQAGMDLLQPGGLISITCYPGHPEGAREQTALLDMVRQLPSDLWSCSYHTWLNRKKCPSLLIIQKNRILET